MNYIYESGCHKTVGYEYLTPKQIEADESTYGKLVGVMCKNGQFVPECSGSARKDVCDLAVVRRMNATV